MLIVVTFELTGTPLGIVLLGTVPFEIEGCCDKVRKSQLMNPLAAVNVHGAGFVLVESTCRCDQSVTAQEGELLHQPVLSVPELNRASGCQVMSTPIWLSITRVRSCPVVASKKPMLVVLGLLRALWYVNPAGGCKLLT